MLKVYILGIGVMREFKMIESVILTENDVVDCVV